MYQYFTDLVAAKREAPGEDLLSALIEARETAWRNSPSACANGARTWPTPAFRAAPLSW